MSLKKPPSQRPMPLRKERMQAQFVRAGDQIMTSDGTFTRIDRVVSKNDGVEIFMANGQRFVPAKTAMIAVQR